MTQYTAVRLKPHKCHVDDQELGSERKNWSEIFEKTRKLQLNVRNKFKKFIAQPGNWQGCIR